MLFATVLEFTVNSINLFYNKEELYCEKEDKLFIPYKHPVNSIATVALMQRCH